MSATDEVVASWSEHSTVGHHYEDLLAGGAVSSRRWPTQWA
ncbi:hypothetical protein [Streptomyces sp. NPDC000410]